MCTVQDDMCTVQDDIYTSLRGAERRGNLLCREGDVLKSYTRDLPAGAWAGVCSCCDQVVPKVLQIACDQHFAHRMGDLSVPEGEALYAEGEVTGHRIAVSAVESRYEYSVPAILQYILQRY